MTDANSFTDVSKILEKLKALGNKERAISDRAYHKSGREHWGVPVPASRLSITREVWDTIVRFLRDLDGWALEDQLAPVARKCILKDEQLLDEVEKWTKHENFWIRRAALVYTLPFAKPGRDPERMLGWASSYASDSEWFIQKAIGWWLRVLGEHNPHRVHKFLHAHEGVLKGVAKKEATRKLSQG